MTSVVLYPDSRAAICGNREKEGRKEREEGEISEAFGRAECEIVSGGGDLAIGICWLGALRCEETKKHEIGRS